MQLVDKGPTVQHFHLRPAPSPEPGSLACSMASEQGLFLCPQISAASLGGQTQILGSLTTPVITSAIPSMPGISSQILTNAQGQASGQSQGGVLGTMGWPFGRGGQGSGREAETLD